MSFLDPELTTIAFCWRLERRDGVCLGFTTHDRDLRIDGVSYRASPGMVPSAISLSDGFEAGTLDVAGALTDDSITGADLQSGRWDGAALELFMVDWEDSGGERLHLASGQLGDVATRGEGFEAELRGPTALLERPVVEHTSPECRAALGDKRCRIDMAPRRLVTRVTAVTGEDSVEVSEASLEANAYGYGEMRWIGGRNSGLTSNVRSSLESTIVLREPALFPVSIGDLVEIIEGCDKRFITCSGRFGNGENFRGEPHLPGMDLLTRYPGAS